MEILKSLAKWLVTVAVSVAISMVLLPKFMPEQANLGASGTRFPNGISTDSTSPNAGQVRATTLTVTGASSQAAVTATSVTSLNGSSTSTVISGSSAIGTNKGYLCGWNGASYTILVFGQNSTSTNTFTTSTSCS